MKGPARWGLAVRRPTGGIFREHWPNSSRTKRFPWKLPVLRGAVVLCEMMATGFKALSRSAEVALEEQEETLTFKDLLIAIAVGIAGPVLEVRCGGAGLRLSTADDVGVIGGNTG